MPNDWSAEPEPQRRMSFVRQANSSDAFDLGMRVGLLFSEIGANEKTDIVLLHNSDKVVIGDDNAVTVVFCTPYTPSGDMWDREIQRIDHEHVVRVELVRYAMILREDVVVPLFIGYDQSVDAIIML